MFLNPHFFKKTFFRSVYKKLINKLENKGIVVFNIKTTIDELKTIYKNTIKNKKQKLSFDGNSFPDTNILYIHLFNGQYFNSNIYAKKKIEIEREMLFLLAGKLGVKEINYETEIIETTITSTTAGLKLKALDKSISFNKSIEKKVGTKGKEEYLNRGAPVYLKSNNLQEVEENIESRMDNMRSNIFNYNFYKTSSKLESFVYKRFEFKMLKLEYTIESEDISDISFSVKSCFMQYGLEFSFDKNVTTNENIHYTLEFFSDLELKKEFGKMKRDFMDKFYSIRELYELIEDKNSAVHLITEYVIELANNNNLGKELVEYIKISDPGTFESVCHQFHSTSQIKNWLNKEFSNINIIDENKSINIDIEINKLRSEEKEELDQFKRKEDNRIEKVNNIDCDGELNINNNDNYNYNDNYLYERTFNLIQEKFIHNICTMVQDENIEIAPEEQLQLVKEELIEIARTPIYPSSDNSLPPTPNNECTDYSDINEIIVQHESSVLTDLTTSYNSLELPPFPVS
jgi:hypothetical protein